MAEMGLKTYRFSISWARIFPKGKGEINEKGIAFYGDVIDECLKNHIDTMVNNLSLGFATGACGFLWRMGERGNY